MIYELEIFEEFVMSNLTDSRTEFCTSNITDRNRSFISVAHGTLELIQLVVGSIEDPTEIGSITNGPCARDRRDPKDLLNFIGRMHTQPRQVRLVHGDDNAKRTLAALLRQLHPGVEVVVP